MNTTRSMNASVAIGVAKKLNTATPATTTRPAASPAARRKILVPGLLAVASCAAIVLVFKAALAINDVLACIDAAYKSSSL